MPDGYSLASMQGKPPLYRYKAVGTYGHLAHFHTGSLYSNSKGILKGTMDTNVGSPRSDEPLYDQVTCFDGSIGRDGQYTRVPLPRPMSKMEASNFCSATNRCPPEAFHRRA